MVFFSLFIVVDFVMDGAASVITGAVDGMGVTWQRPKKTPNRFEIIFPLGVDALFAEGEAEGACHALVPKISWIAARLRLCTQGSQRQPMPRYRSDPGPPPQARQRRLLRFRSRRVELR